MTKYKNSSKQIYTSHRSYFTCHKKNFKRKNSSRQSLCTFEYRKITRRVFLIKKKSESEILNMERASYRIALLKSLTAHFKFYE